MGAVNLVQRLSDEVFDGRPISWRSASWSDIPVETVDGGDRHFYKQDNGTIFAQRKRGDLIPYCFACDTPANVLRSTESHRDGLFLCSGDGSVRHKHKLYCRLCSGEPYSGQLLTLEL